MESPSVPTVPARDRSYDVLWWLALLLPVLGIAAWHAQLLYPLSYFFGRLNGAFTLGGIHNVILWLGPFTLIVFSLPIVLWPGRLRPALQFYGAMLLIDIILFEVLAFQGLRHSNDPSWGFLGMMLMPIYITNFFFIYFCIAFTAAILRKYIHPSKSILAGVTVAGALICTYDYTFQIGLVIAKMQPGWKEVMEFGRSGGVMHVPGFAVPPEPPLVSHYLEQYSKEGWRAHCAQFPKPWSSEYIPTNDYTMCNAAGALHFSDPSFCTGLPGGPGTYNGWSNEEPQKQCIFQVVLKTGNPAICEGFAGVATCRAFLERQKNLAESGLSIKEIVDHCNAIRPSQPYTPDPRDEVYTDLAEALAHPDDVKVLSLRGVTHLPPEIKTLKNLQLLDLSDNYMLTELPPEIDTLEQLRIINVANNSLKTFPPLTRLCMLERVDIRQNLMEMGEQTNLARSLMLLNPKAVEIYYPQKGFVAISSSSSSAALPAPQFGFGCRRSDVGVPTDQSIFMKGYVFGDAILRNVDGTVRFVKIHDSCDGNTLRQNHCSEECKPGDLCFYGGGVVCPNGCVDGACVR